jgi:hypothetical protein
MSTALNRRIAALEKAKPPATGPRIIRLVAVHPDGRREPRGCIVVRGPAP